MKAIAILALLLATVSSGCKVCGIGACAKDQGQAIAGIAPQSDGSILVTTCSLVTKGSGATLSNCKQQKLPRP